MYFEYVFAFHIIDFQQCLFFQIFNFQYCLFFQIIHFYFFFFSGCHLDDRRTVCWMDGGDPCAFGTRPSNCFVEEKLGRFD
jgi:hypothetical protein